jgi:3-deoxy-D-manno-octulosonate 8-phosphate phosphatase (KDO 8-P phosphatase)
MTTLKFSLSEEVLAKVAKVKLLLLDVDGVLTDGKIVIDDQGKETKIFNVLDGFGIVIFRKCGYKVAIISARAAGAVNARAKDLNIDKVYQAAFPKMDSYVKLLAEMKLKDEDICFIGDDLPDLGVLKRVGFAVTVPNAVAEVKKIAHYITTNTGGAGAVREVIEIILKTQGRWDNIIENLD